MMPLLQPIRVFYKRLPNEILLIIELQKPRLRSQRARVRGRNDQGVPNKVAHQHAVPAKIKIGRGKQNATPRRYILNQVMF